MPRQPSNHLQSLFPAWRKVCQLFPLCLVKNPTALAVWSVKNDIAESDKQGRYLTIINHTDQIINEVHITVGEGTEIEHGYQENPDEESFSVEIPEEYKEYSTFTVTFVDRYGMKYQKKITDVSERGRTEVEIMEEDYVEQDGDLTRKIDRFFNGD